MIPARIPRNLDVLYVTEFTISSMKKLRVILLASHRLLGEGLSNLLGGLVDVELIGPWVPDPEHLERLSEENPDVILLVNEEADAEQAIAAQIIAKFPDYPLLQVSTEQSSVRVYTSESRFSSSAELIETIRQLSKKEIREE